MNTIPVEYNQSLFNLSTPKKSYLSHSNETALNKLIAGLKSDKKLFLISGQKKCGKTTLVQRAISELKKKPLVITIDPTPPLTYENLLDCVGNNIKENFSSETIIDRQTANSLDIKSAILKELIQEESISHIIFIIHQSLELQPAVLKKALNLVNSSIFSSCLPQIIITGLTGLEAKIKEFNVSVSNKDITSLQVEPLSENDIRTYINVHLQGLREQGKNLFSNAAIERIIYYSKGLPGLINSLCNQGLLTANIGEKSTITEEVMDEVLENSLFLGNDFDYTASESPSPDSYSFDQFIPLAKQEDDEMNQRYIEDEVIKQDVTPWRQKKRIKEVEQRSHKRHSLTKSQTPVGQSPKAIIISAFVMGILVTALANYGWNFFNPSETEQEASAGDKYTDIELPQQQAQVTSEAEEERVLSTSDRPVVADNGTLSPDNSNEELAEPSKADQITQVLLKHAGEQLKDKQLISPAQDNAWATYKKILEISPNNQAALSGINTIKETYVTWAINKINKGDKAQATDYLKKALETSPGDSQVLEILASLNKTSAVAKPTETAASTTTTNDQSGHNELNQLLAEPDGIPALLTLAQLRVSEKNLTTPKNNNALSIYKLILSRNSEHKEALAGIKNIKNKYLMWAKHEIKQGNFRHAEYLYTKALEVSPSDPEALSDLQQLKNTTGNY